MRINEELLKDQYNFLSSYAWREGYEPEQVTGILNLLEEILEEERANENLLNN